LRYCTHSLCRRHGRMVLWCTIISCCNAYQMSIESMMWVRYGSICAYVLPYHSIFLHAHFRKSGKCWLKPTQTATTSSISCWRHGPIWPKLEQNVMSCQHVATCWQHFQLGQGGDVCAVSPLIDLGTQHDGRSARTWMKRV
jgi:hypothetical protein